MLNAKLFGLIAIILLFSMTFSASAQPVEIRYFYQPGCYDCRLSEPIINQIEIQNNNITITKINVNTVCSVCGQFLHWSNVLSGTHPHHTQVEPGR